jgi:hypothetical protein
MRVLWLADVLRAAGCAVVEHAGWQTRGWEPWEPQCGIVHATAAPRTQPDATQVAIVRDGRSDLEGPIANATVTRDGTWHVLASGRCNTTLAGYDGTPFAGYGNQRCLGIEACNDNVSEPWPAVQYEAYARGWAAICRRLGWSSGRLVGHKEHTPGRKTDPTFDMGQFRARVGAYLAGKVEDMAVELEPRQAGALTVAYQAGHALIHGGARTVPGGTDKGGAPVWIVGQVAALRAELAALTAVVASLARAVEAGGGSVDTAAILAGVDERLAALRAELPEAVADEAADELAARLAG